MIDFDRPEMAEECGVFGVCGSGEDVARIAFFGLFSLQHRGQESAGIAVSDGNIIRMHRDMGLVTQVFQEEVLSSLTGHIGIGHTRYSTTGSSILRNVQPMRCDCTFGEIALAHNGDLVNAGQIREELTAQGIEFETTNDSEVIIKLIAASGACNLEDAIADAMSKIRGAYAVLVMSEDKLIAFRDPFGIRPLSIGQLNGSHYVVASETCAFNTIGARYMREVEPGEMIIMDADGLRERQAIPTDGHALCIFEYVYFARPDSRMYGRTMHEARRRMGHELAKEHPCPGAHIVFPLPNTGTPAAIGLAEASRIPYAEGVIKNHYIHRTFIQPDQRMRELGVRMKLTPLKETLAGRRVVMVDDSIVRGTTSGPTIKMIRDAGAVEVHVRIASPPIKHPCFYGIDTANQNELIAAKLSIEEIRQYIGADSLGYLSLAGLIRAIGVKKDKLCCACLDGKYPVDVSRQAKLSKFVFEEPAPA
ncbi:MAG: amidophosphoribosyltransferase [Armatimonadetes bacterium]|nr:amidophosphoribosyltransferase [Armatimonadota bacterium]